MHEDIPDSFMDGYDVSFCSFHLIWQLGSQIQNISAEKNALLFIIRPCSNKLHEIHRLIALCGVEGTIIGAM